jgi:hypothetical protein
MLDLVALGFLVTFQKIDSEPKAIPDNLSGFHSHFLFRRGEGFFLPTFFFFFCPPPLNLAYKPNPVPLNMDRWKFEKKSP